jgi:hypothetical protein
MKATGPSTVLGTGPSTLLGTGLRGWEALSKCPFSSPGNSPPAEPGGRVAQW